MNEEILSQLRSAVIQNMITMRGSEDGEYISRVIHEEGFEPDPKKLIEITIGYLTGMTIMLNEQGKEIMLTEIQLAETTTIALKACRRLDTLDDLQGQILLNKLGRIGLDGDSDA